MSYIEQSLRVIKSLRVDELQNCRLGTIAGDLGTTFCTRTLGAEPMTPPGFFVATKLPRTSQVSPDVRVLHDVAFLDMLAKQVPTVRPLLPKFSAVLAIDCPDNAVAVLTEDVSQGNEVSVRAAPLDPAIIDEIGHAFSWAGPPHRIFEKSSLRRVVTFDVDNTQRLLDFTPSIFRAPYRN
jgi:hypothetical protein